MDLVKIQPILFVDAGCLANNSILNTYSHAVAQLRELGFEPKIAWWGQADKNGEDIDEISEDTLAAIQLLSYREFLNLEQKAERERQIEATQQQLQSLTVEPDISLSSGPHRHLLG